MSRVRERATKKMQYDLKTKWDRIGYSILFRKLARATVYAGMFMMFLFLLATMFIVKATAEINYKDSIAEIRYQNIKR